MTADNFRDEWNDEMARRPVICHSCGNQVTFEEYIKICNQQKRDGVEYEKLGCYRCLFRNKSEARTENKARPMTPSEAAQQLIRAIADNHPLTRDAILNKYGEAIARALVAAEERERGYRSAIINVIEGCHIFTAGINILQSALDHDEATGKSGG